MPCRCGCGFRLRVFRFDLTGRPARQAGGTTPRISLAWNTNRKVLPGSMLDAVKQQRPEQAD